MFTSLILLLSLALCTYSSEHVEKCYHYVGCFDNSPPFDIANGHLPLSPEELDIKLHLFTTKNVAEPDVLDYKDASSIKQSHFNVKLPVKIIVHGYFSRGSGNWVTILKNEILKKEKVNVITVDWRIGAATVNYEQAIANTRMVAMQMKLLLKLMVDHLHLPLQNVHLIGHSLGAHTSGYVGHMFGSKIGRITAMDASEPNFKDADPTVRVDGSDAIFVDAIHTDSKPFTSFGVDGGLGLMMSYGDVDFYVNGGTDQPGCKTVMESIWNFFGMGKRSLSKTVACSHVRAHEVFIASINNPCLFRAFPCDNYKKFLRGECTTCGGEGCGVLGYYSNKYSKRGKKYLRTLSEDPYCGYQYEIKASIESTKDIWNADGELHINFGASVNDLTSSGILKVTDAKVDSLTYQGVIIVDKHVQPIEIVVAHVKSNRKDYPTPSFVINSLEVTSLDSNRKVSSVPGPYSAGGQISAVIPMLDGDAIIG